MTLDALVAISTYANKKTSTPTLNQHERWVTVRSWLMHRVIRAQKDGPLLGGFMTKGTRCNEDVGARSLVQLDIDTKTKKDRQTGEEQIIWTAPPFEDICHLIDSLEYVAASSHRHDPANGMIKYRVTLLPDREIGPDEHLAVLEALDERVGGILDRDAWQWPQAFYLPSCPLERAGDAFEVYNKGALLPADMFVARGSVILAAKDTKPSLPTSTKLGVNIGRAPPPVETMRAMLRFLAERGVFVNRMADKVDADGRIVELAWIKAGMALKVAYGDDVGFELWAETHEDDQARADAPRQWASFKTE